MLTPKILKYNDYKCSTWAGGETREILLYPETGDYGQRNFDLRISTATVELPESDFSDLTGFQRILTLLEGEIQLTHQGSSPVLLSPGKIWYFDGGVETSSKGTCTDYNVIYTDEFQVELVQGIAGESWSAEKGQLISVFSLVPDLKITGSSSRQEATYSLGKWDTLALENLMGEPVSWTLSHSQISDRTPLALVMMAEHQN